MSKEEVYIVLDTKKVIPINDNVYVKDVALVSCQDTNIQKKVENVKVYKGKAEEDWDFIGADEITDKVLAKHKDVNINMLGSPEVLLEIKSFGDNRGIMQFIKVLLVCIIIFWGAGMAIINFHEDVNMVKSIEKVYYTITGNKKSTPLIMTIPYSIGIGVGVITFFSRIISRSRRRRKEPGPMEIELFLYDQDMEQYILNELKKEKAEDGS